MLGKLEVPGKEGREEIGKGEIAVRRGSARSSCIGLKLRCLDWIQKVVSPELFWNHWECWGKFPGKNGNVWESPSIENLHRERLERFRMNLPLSKMGWNSCVHPGSRKLFAWNDPELSRKLGPYGAQKPINRATVQAVAQYELSSRRRRTSPA